MEYLREFETLSEYDAFSNSDAYVSPNTSLIKDVGIKYDKKQEPVPSHPYVEIAGLRWATMNLGAESVTDYGLWYQWAGDISGGTKNTKSYSYSTYPYGSSDQEQTKYNSTDGKTVVEPEDDAVTVNWGEGWRTPTWDEYKELVSATTSAWTTDYLGSGVNGLLLTDKTDSSKVLFFPAAGAIENKSFVDTNVCYWSSSIYSFAGRCLKAVQSGISEESYSYGRRYMGLTIRGVMDL